MQDVANPVSLSSFYFGIVTGTKFRRIRWAEYVLHIGRAKYASKIGVCEPKRSRAFGRTKCMLDDELDLGEM
jgi:hypothetical protein